MEIGEVFGDDHLRMCTNGGRQHMAIFRVIRQTGHELLVSRDCCFGKHIPHYTDEPSGTFLIRKCVFYEVTLYFGEDLRTPV